MPSIADYFRQPTGALASALDAGAQWGRGAQSRGKELLGLLDPQAWAQAMRTLPNPQALMNQPMTPQEQQGVGQQGVARALDIGPGALGKLGAMAAHTVYHGSPHIFDKFDMSKIGTGEGAQAYGHGMYFAENQGVADGYRRALSDHAIEVGGQRIAPTKGSVEDRAAAWVQGAVDAQPTNPFAYAKQQARSILGKSSSVADDIIKQIEAWQRAGAEIKGGGATYKVDIPDDAIPKMLDWDKPLSGQQSAQIASALKNITPVSVGHGKYGAALVGPDGSGRLLSGVSADSADGIMAAVAKNFEGVNGASAYNDIVKWLGGQEKATAALRSAGIPGIRYLDAGSRAGGQGTANFVLFDDQMAKILERQ